ncbi:hypothetical protein JCM10449v2_005781 [Rhodotorula kratochvilovae]
MAAFKPLSRKERAKFEAVLADAREGGRLGKVISSLEDGVRRYEALGNGRRVQHRKERLYFATHARWEVETVVSPDDEGTQDDDMQVENPVPAGKIQVLDLTLMSDSDDDLPTASAPSSARAALSSRHGPSSRAAADADDELATSIDLPARRRSTSLGRIIPRSPSPELYGPGCAPAENAPVSPFGAGEARGGGKGKGKARAREESLGPLAHDGGEEAETGRANMDVEEEGETAKQPGAMASVTATSKTKRRTSGDGYVTNARPPLSPRVELEPPPGAAPSSSEEERQQPKQRARTPSPMSSWLRALRTPVAERPVAEEPVASTSKVPYGPSAGPGPSPFSPSSGTGTVRVERRSVGRSSSPEIVVKRRRKGVERLGDLVEHDATVVGTEGSSAEDASSAEATTLLRKRKKGEKGRGRDRDRGESKPVFATPRVATTFSPHQSVQICTHGTSLAEMKAANEADEEAMLELERRVREARQRKTKVKGKHARGTGRVLVDQGRKSHQVPSDEIEIFVAARVDGHKYRRGQWVVTVGEGAKPWIGRIVYFHDAPGKTGGDLQVHLQWASTSRSLHGSFANARHLLLCSSSPASSIVQAVDVREGNEVTVPAPSFFYLAMYMEDKSTVPPPPFDGPTPTCDENDVVPCSACERRLVREGAIEIDAQGDAVPLPAWIDEVTRISCGFKYDGDDYHVNDTVYLRASTEAQEEPHWNGAQAPFRLARLVRLKGSPAKLRPTTTLVVQPFLRYGHLRETKRRKERQLVATDDLAEVSLEELVGHFRLVHGRAPKSDAIEPDTFFVCKQIVPPPDDQMRDTISALWHHPPTLLAPPSDVDANVLAFLAPLDESELKRCAICTTRMERNDAEEDEVRRRAAEGFKLSGLSVYSGVDLLGIGLERGLPLLDTKVAIEGDEDVAKACRLNHPGVDVRCAPVDEALKRAFIKRFEGNTADMEVDENDEGDFDILDVDFVYGGPPCQPFSALNRWPDPRDPRIVQVAVFLSFFEGGRPLMGLMENVARLSTFSYGSSEPGNLMGAVTDLAIRLGYDIRPVVLNAAAYGVAQHRRRLFLMLVKRGLPLPDVPEPTHAVSTRFTGQTVSQGDRDDDTATKVPFGRRAALQSAPHPAVVVKEAFAGLPDYDAEREDANVTGPGSLVDNGNDNDFCIMPSQTVFDRIEQIGLREEGGNAKGNYEDLPPDLAVRPPRGVSARKKEDFYRRLWPEEIVSTLTTRMRPEGLDGCCIHPFRNRLLSLRECLVLQGARDNLRLFSLGGADEAPSKDDVERGHKLIGNGVAVPVAAALGREMGKILAPLVLRETARSSDKQRALGESNAGVDDVEPAAFFASISRRLDKGGRFDGLGPDGAG